MDLSRGLLPGEAGVDLQLDFQQDSAASFQRWRRVANAQTHTYAYTVLHTHTHRQLQTLSKHALNIIGRRFLTYIKKLNEWAKVQAVQTELKSRLWHTL